MLGVKLGMNNSTSNSKNYECKLGKIENCIKIWRTRDLSLMGRIHIVKSLASSQLVYNWSNLPKPPESFFKDLDSKLYHFIWNSKTDRVKRVTLIAPYNEGGLKMVDSRTQCKALKLKWIKYIKEQYQMSSQDFWFNWLKQCIPQIDIMDLFRCNLNCRDMNKVCRSQCTPFWQEVLQIWSEWNYNDHPMTKLEIIRPPIWFNSLLRIGGSTCHHILQKMVRK